MAIFKFTGQAASFKWTDSEGNGSFVVNNELPLSFTIESGTESYFGNDPKTDFNESLDDKITFTDYNGNLITEASFIVIYEGTANWSTGNSVAPPQFTSDVAVIQVTLPDGSTTTYSLILSNPPSPNVANPNKGTIHNTFKLGDHRATTNEDDVICFVEGTLISTPTGNTRIEALSEGDLVMTRDHGALPIRWISSSVVLCDKRTRPIQFAVGALGANCPSAPLSVSPAHRMLISGAVAELLFDCESILVHADNLINDDTIRPDFRAKFVRYFHLMFDEHEIIFANGAQAESFHPGEAMDTESGRRCAAELAHLFPDMDIVAQYGRALCPTIGASEARLLSHYMN